MGESIRRGECLWADIALIQVSIGVPSYLYDPVPFSPDEKSAPAMIHPGAVRFHPSRGICHETILPKKKPFWPFMPSPQGGHPLFRAGPLAGARHPGFFT
jgi:hypothetical protein